MFIDHSKILSHCQIKYSPSASVSSFFHSSSLFYSSPFSSSFCSFPLSLSLSLPSPLSFTSCSLSLPLLSPFLFSFRSNFRSFVFPLLLFQSYTSSSISYYQRVSHGLYMALHELNIHVVAGRALVVYCIVFRDL